MPDPVLTIASAIFTLIAAFIIYKYVARKPEGQLTKDSKALPAGYRDILKKRVSYYNHITDERKQEFEKRILKFLTEKKVTGVDTDVSDADLVLVAASAIIPMFAFPYYRYPGVREILLYPNSFDKQFNTNEKADGRDILGMVGDGFLKGHVLLSKPDLEAAFDGTRHKNNVGIHEFIHLIDKADGATDGIPEILFKHSFSFSWLREIKKEIDKIKHGHSDINPYARTNNAEFLAVVGEYFFDDPEKMKFRHPELYQYLSNIFHQDPT